MVYTVIEAKDLVSCQGQTATCLDLESMAQMVFIKVNQKLDFWQSRCLYGRELETLAVFMHCVILIIYFFSW